MGLGVSGSCWLVGVLVVPLCPGQVISHGQETYKTFQTRIITARNISLLGFMRHMESLRWLSWQLNISINIMRTPTQDEDSKVDKIFHLKRSLKTRYKIKTCYLEHWTVNTHSITRGKCLLDLSGATGEGGGAGRNRTVSECMYA